MKSSESTSLKNGWDAKPWSAGFSLRPATMRRSAELQLGDLILRLVATEIDYADELELGVP